MLRHIFGLQYVNDIRHLDEEKVVHKIQENSSFSLSYVLLLSAAIAVCTLGLLLDSSPVVIGGMLLSPLMWPLLHIAVGISEEQVRSIRKGLALLLLSVGVSIISTVIITYISPIKVISNEILARTQPTLIDIIVAIVGGGIAALSITQPKISDSVAGVAVATALMPPLCVGGIGITLQNQEVFTGGMLLFASNVFSIVFVGTLTFFILGITRTSKQRIKFKAIVVLLAMLIGISIPLFNYLQSYVFKTFAYDQVQASLHRTLGKISPDISIDNVKTTVVDGEQGEVVLVESDIYLPDNLAIDYQQKEEIVNNLERVLDRKINLNLRLQQTISFTNPEDQKLEEKKKAIKDILVKEVNMINPNFSVNTVTVEYEEAKDLFYVTSVLRGDPTTPFTEKQRDFLEESMRTKLNTDLSVDIEILSRIRLVSEPDLQIQQVRQEIEEAVVTLTEAENVELASFSYAPPILSSETLLPTATSAARVSIELKVPQDYEIPNDTLEELKNSLQETYGIPFTFGISLIERKQIAL